MEPRNEAQGLFRVPLGARAQALTNTLVIIPPTTTPPGSAHVCGMSHATVVGVSQPPVSSTTQSAVYAKQMATISPTQAHYRHQREPLRCATNLLRITTVHRAPASSTVLPILGGCFKSYLQFRQSEISVPFSLCHILHITHTRRRNRNIDCIVLWLESRSKWLRPRIMMGTAVGRFPLVLQAFQCIVEIFRWQHFRSVSNKSHNCSCATCHRWQGYFSCHPTVRLVTSFRVFQGTILLQTLLSHTMVGLATKFSDAPHFRSSTPHPQPYFEKLPDGRSYGL